MRIVSTGSTLSSPEFHQKKKRERKRRLYFWSTALILLLISLILLAREERFQISSLNIEGVKTVNEENVKEVTNQMLSGYYLGVVPRSNFALYPSRDIERILLKKFPRFSSVTLALEGAKLLKITANEREPFALYCADIASPEDAADCYFLDDNGYIFDHAPSFSGPVYFIYASTEPLAEPLGQSFLPVSEFKSLAKFVESLSNLGIHPLALKAGPDDWSLALPGGGNILWLRSGDLSLVYSNLEAFLKSDAIRKQPDFLQRVKELDLRTENKVRWTFKE